MVPATMTPGIMVGVGHAGWQEVRGEERGQWHIDSQPESGPHPYPEDAGRRWGFPSTGEGRVCPKADLP